jgi:hypothetical protein
MQEAPEAHLGSSVSPPGTNFRPPGKISTLIEVPQHCGAQHMTPSRVYQFDRSGVPDHGASCAGLRRLVH